MTRNPEIANTPVWILRNIWGLGQVRDITLADISNEMLQNAAKCQGYRFFHFWVINGKRARKLKLLPTQIIVKLFLFHVRVADSKLKNKELHFQLLTPSGKVFNFSFSY